MNFDQQKINFLSFGKSTFQNSDKANQTSLKSISGFSAAD
jgi:hypothetical protein